jgi:outer membrane protein assembly factor BamB
VRIKYKILLSALSVLLLVMLVISGCTGSIKSRGWAGGAVLNNTLFVASMSGKLIAIDSTSGTILEPAVQLTVQSSGGFSCLPSSCGRSSSSGVVIYASPVVQGTVVYIGGTDGKIYGYSFVDNKLKADAEWIYPRQGTMSGSIIGNLTVVNDIVYFATSDGVVYALDANGLYIKWSHKIGNKIWSAPVVDGDTLYIGCFDKKIYALNISDGTEKWNYETSGAIDSTPVVYDNKVYIGTYDRNFYALNAADGKLIWKFPNVAKDNDNPQNWFWATPVIVNGVIYAPCLDGNIYALDAGNGNLVKKFILGDTISSSPVVMGDSIVVATTNLYKKTSKVFIINTLENSQQELENFAEGIDAPLFINNDVVYIHTTKDNLYGINVLTGAKQTFSLSTVK